MNRWLMPFLVTGVVSTIALLTLSPLALSIKATPDSHTVTLDPETPSTSQPHSLPTKTPLPPRAAIPRTAHPVAETAAAPLIQGQSLTQLLAPRACYGGQPAPEVMRPGALPAAAAHPTTTAHTPSTGHPSDTMGALPPASAALAVALADLINQQRQRYGIPSLTVVPTLTLAAYHHSLDMATQTTPVHQGSDGSSGGGRMMAAGYQWQAWAEVIGWGFADPATMVTWWLNDAEHRAVLLSPAFTEFGIGYATLGHTLWQTYWTVNFGRPAAITMSSVPLTTSTATLAQALTPTAPPPVKSITEQPPTDTLPTEALATCPTTSTQSYALIPMEGIDLTHPAPRHGDLNLAQRGYIAVAAQAQLVDLAGPVDPDAPQLAQLFADHQPMQMTSLYQVADWQWQCGDHGCRGASLSAPEVTLLGLQTQPGTALYAPARQASIYRDNAGNDYIATVLYAETDRLTLAYTRDGSVANGYVVHLEQVCVDPNLVQRYAEADSAGRWQLPGLQHSQPFGTATATEVRVAMRDRGAFLDPRSRKDWWRGF